MTSPATAAPKGPIDRRVLALAPALRVHLAVSSVAAVAIAAAILLQAEAVGRWVPDLVAGRHEVGGRLVATLLGLALLRGLVAMVVDRSATAALEATRRSVRARVLDRVERVRPDHRNDLDAGDVAALTTTSLDALEPWVRSYLPGLTVALVVPLAAGLRILGADLASALILAVAVPLIPIFMILIGRFTEAQQDRQWDALQRLTVRFLDVLSGLPTLRMFGRATAQVDRVREVTERYRAATMRTLRVAFLSALVLELLATLSVALVAVALGIRLTDGDLTLQTALVVLLLAPECVLPIRRVAAAFHASTAGIDAAEAIARAASLPIRPTGSLPVAGDAVLAAAAVAHHGARAQARLRPVTLRAEPGRVLVVRGPSGAGKSTLLDVLRGALAPSEGQVLLGGVAIDEIEAGAVAAAVAWVPQRPAALGPTVAASVALGHPTGDATDAAAARAIEGVGIAHVRDHHPDAVSGGERRRAALARALVGVELGTTRTLLVDEPTAQLDAASAARVVAALRWAATQGAAVVAATHDDELAAAADDVVELQPPDDRPAPAPPAAPERERHRVGAATVPDPVPGWAVGSTGPEAADSGSLAWVLQRARSQRWRLLAAAGLGALTELSSLALAATAAWLIVRAAEQPSFADLAVAAVGVRAFALGKAVLRYAERLTSHDATLRLLADLRAGVVERLTHLAPTGLPPDRRGDILGRLVDDVDRLQDLFLRVLGPIAGAGTAALVATGGAVLLDPLAGLALGAGVLVLGAMAPAAAHRSTRRALAGAAPRRAALQASVVDLAAHAEELVACRAAAGARARIEEAATDLVALDRGRTRTTMVLAGLAAAGPGVVAAGVVAALAWGAGAPTGPAVGVLVLLALAVAELLGPLAATGDALGQVEVAADRVHALVRAPDPVAEPAEPEAAPARTDLALAGVAVGWPGTRAVATGIDLDLAERGRAVLVGPSGSGKSTVAATLVRFLDPVAGSYELGGRPAAALGGDTTRATVTWCQQDPWFARSTLADNLRIAHPAATDDALWAALAAVHLNRWARTLPDGLGTWLEHDASAMSGGERQRLALARALLGGQAVVVLDEPTAHLDEETAGAVLTDLLAAAADRSVLVITHDRPTGALADAPVHRLVRDPRGPARWEAAPEGG